jgi:diguanylate cyclase (GGDEF)-like protein
MNEVLFSVADAMRPTTLFVTRVDIVATAAKLIAQHKLAALPVLDGNRILGLVTPLSLLTAPPYRLVTDVMTAQNITPATPALPLSQAYALKIGQRVEVLPVVVDGKIVGEITSAAIFRVQGQQTDPLTDLPFSTAARAWSVAALERGHEITILFLDLDNFGAVNKTFGHVAGDNILCTVAHLLNSLVDVETDILCRYGGDEFVIATTRRKADADELMQRIQDVVAVPIDPGEAGRHVTVSVGIAGGRRTEGRERAHIAATVDDLLTLASRASTLAKEGKRAGAPAPVRGPAGDGEGTTTTAAVHATEVIPAPITSLEGARLRLIRVMVNTDAKGSEVTVALGAGAREGVGRADGQVHGEGMLFLVASATLDAIRRTAGESHAFVLEELHEVPVATEKLVVAVLTSTSVAPRLFAGAACATDLPHAVTKAILAALNRRLAKPSAESRSS